MEQETITITMAQYNSLVEDSEKLAALEAGGVDNWEWYDESLRAYFGDNDEDEG